MAAAFQDRPGVPCKLGEPWLTAMIDGGHVGLPSALRLLVAV